MEILNNFVRIIHKEIKQGQEKIDIKFDSRIINNVYINKKIKFYVRFFDLFLKYNSIDIKDDFLKILMIDKINRNNKLREKLKHQKKTVHTVNKIIRINWTNECYFYLLKLLCDEEKT